MTDLQIDLGPGRRSKPLEITSERDLTVEDLASLKENRATQPPTIKSIRERHHSIARYISLGLSNADVAAVCGLSESRVSTLKKDPLFANLISMYQKNRADDADRIMDQFRSLTGESLGLLLDRIEEAPEDFSNAALLEIAKTLGDRAGYSPVQKQESMVGVVDMRAMLDAGRKRALEAKQNIIEGEVVDATADLT